LRAHQAASDVSQAGAAHAAKEEAQMQMTIARQSSPSGDGRLAPMPEMPPRKLLLVDDHELVRCGVRTLYDEIDGVPLHWLEADSLQEALEIYGREPDIDAVLLDLNLADCKGLQGLRQFIHAFPHARVAVFSATQDEFVVRQARAMGAAGYVPKGAGAAETRETLVALLWPQGGQRRGFPSSTALFPRFPSSAMYDRVAEFGPRHLEILELVLSGCTNQEISNSMHLSLGTVKNYVSSLLLALDVKSRSHMVSLFR
jgi:DNA-binding NarL/FixJ family response regulator